MSVKTRLRSGLTGAREFSEGMLANFKTPDQWTHMVHDKANHALWFVGHIAVVDDFLISLIDAGKASAKPGYAQKFGMGSKPTGNAADYPPADELLAYMRERRQTALAILDDLSEGDFDKATPDGSPPFLSTYGSVFHMAAWHEGFHLGQVSVAARALGIPPRI